MSTPARTALLISGGGRTALNLLAHARAGSLPIDVVTAISTRADCAGVARLRGAGVECSVVARNDFNGSPRAIEAMHDRTDAVLLAAGVELICLCGWLRHFRVDGGASGADWSGQTLNIHPSLLPAFGGQGMHGIRVHEAVLRSGATESGCTVHYVDAVYDHGPTILQRRVPVLPDDDAATLAVRVFEQELVAYPDAIRLVAADRP